MNLNTYYATKHWKVFSAKIRAQTPYCEVCRDTKDLHVHHLHYNHFYRENRRDVKVLCKKCHLKGVHKQLDWEDLLDMGQKL